MNIRHILTLTLTASVLLFSGQEASAKSKDKRPNYKTLVNLNRQLSARNDSLQSVIDSLISAYTAQKAITDSISEYIMSANDKLEDQIIFNGPVPDSLLVTGPEMDDSCEVERFSSNVSDSVLIRRLAAMRTIVTLPYNSTVRSYMVKYSERGAAQVSRMLGDAKYFFPIFEEILSNYDMPQELKYMSVIESAFKTKARSRVGARGLWQFMYSTARRYGLNIDSFVDERMDTYKATDAAVRYLRDAYDELGDWSLAIASYNCGTHNVQKAIKKAGRSDFWSIYPYLPRETRGYLPAFVGAMYAMVYHKECGIEEGPAPFDGEPVDSVKINRKLHFRQLNEVIGVPAATVETLNSQYIHNVIPAGDDKSYTLRLPRSWMKKMEETEPDSLFNYKAEELFVKSVLVSKDSRGTRKSDGGVTYYKIKSGDTLGRIAQRFGVSVRSLKSANGLRSDTIRAGRTLVIPN